MTWGKMDDKAHRNRKVRKLYRMGAKGREAYGVWAFRWSWCLDDPDLNGFVPVDELDAAELKSAELLCSDLHEGRGLWERVEGGYKFHDFHEYNPTKEQVESKRKYDRERKKSERNPNGSRTESDVVPRGTGDDSDGSRFPRASPIPIPIPSQTQGERARAGAPPPPPHPDPPELEPGEPDCDPSERLRIPALVCQEFSRVCTETTGNHPSWPATSMAHCDTIAAWLDRNHGDDPRRALSRLLAGFFANSRAEAKRFPIAFLATNPDEYFSPPKARRDVRSGYLAPAPASAFTSPTNLDDLFGPETSPGGE